MREERENGGKTRVLDTYVYMCVVPEPNLAADLACGFAVYKHACVHVFEAAYPISGDDE